MPSSRGSCQPRSPALQVDSLPSEPQGKTLILAYGNLYLWLGSFQESWGRLGRDEDILCPVMTEAKWADAATSQGRPEAGRGGKGHALEPPEGAWPSRGMSSLRASDSPVR